MIDFHWNFLWNRLFCAMKTEIQRGKISWFCVPNRMRSPLNVKFWEIVYLILNYIISRARINWRRSLVYRASWRCEERRFNQQYSTHHTLYWFVRFRFCLVTQTALQIDTVYSETQTRCKSAEFAAFPRFFQPIWNQRRTRFFLRYLLISGGFPRWLSLSPLFLISL